MKHLILLMLFVTIISMGAAEGADPGKSSKAESPWQVLEPGLEFGELLAPLASENGDSLIRVLRIDPNRFEFRLLNASAPGENDLLTVKAWCQQHNLVAAINASMYQGDYRTSVSFMRTKDHVNNPRLSKDKAILAFDRRTADIPLLKIIDRQCERFEEWQDKYGTFVQSIRMISCKGTNVWTPQPEKWSTAIIGIDQQGRGLFIHVRSPYSPYDLINILLALPLQISRAIYVEGGREAQLYVRSGKQEYEFVGSYGSGFSNGSGNQYAHPIPNVVGIARRQNPAKTE
jgi:hypothetical protein